MMVPAGDDIEEMIMEEDVGWILVLEKEVIYRYPNWTYQFR